MVFLSLIFEFWGFILPIMLILEIVLFVLSIVRNRYIVALLAVGALGVVYSVLGAVYFNGLDSEFLFEFFLDYIVCYLSIYVFIILTLVFGFVFKIVHFVRQRKVA